MPAKPQPTLSHPEFWKRMEENSKIVKNFPEWLKGSPVNTRSPAQHPRTSSAPTRPETDSPTT